MSYKLNISKEKIDELRALQKKTSHIKIYKRLQCILMISKRYSKTEIADIMDVSNNTVTTWLKLYTKRGGRIIINF